MTVVSAEIAVAARSSPTTPTMSVKQLVKLPSATNSESARTIDSVADPLQLLKGVGKSAADGLMSSEALSQLDHATGAPRLEKEGHSVLRDAGAFTGLIACKRSYSGDTVPDVTISGTLGCFCGVVPSVRSYRTASTDVSSGHLLNGSISTEESLLPKCEACAVGGGLSDGTGVNCRLLAPSEEAAPSLLTREGEGGVVGPAVVGKSKLPVDPHNINIRGDCCNPTQGVASPAHLCRNTSAGDGDVSSVGGLENGRDAGGRGLEDYCQTGHIPKRSYRCLYSIATALETALRLTEAGESSSRLSEVTPGSEGALGLQSKLLLEGVKKKQESTNIASGTANSKVLGRNAAVTTGKQTLEGKVLGPESRNRSLIPVSGTGLSRADSLYSESSTLEGRDTAPIALEGVESADGGNFTSTRPSRPKAKAVTSREAERAEQTECCANGASASFRDDQHNSGYLAGTKFESVRTAPLTNDSASYVTVDYSSVLFGLPKSQLTCASAYESRSLPDAPVPRAVAYQASQGVVNSRFSMKKSSSCSSEGQSEILRGKWSYPLNGHPLLLREQDTTVLLDRGEVTLPEGYIADRFVPQPSTVSMYDMYQILYPEYFREVMQVSPSCPFSPTWDLGMKTPWSASHFRSSLVNGGAEQSGTSFLKPRIDGQEPPDFEGRAYNVSLGTNMCHPRLDRPLRSRKKHRSSPYLSQAQTVLRCPQLLLDGMSELEIQMWKRSRGLSLPRVQGTRVNRQSDAQLGSPAASATPRASVLSEKSGSNVAARTAVDRSTCSVPVYQPSPLHQRWQPCLSSCVASRSKASRRAASTSEKGTLNGVAIPPLRVISTAAVEALNATFDKEQRPGSFADGGQHTTSASEGSTAFLLSVKDQVAALHRLTRRQQQQQDHHHHLQRASQQVEESLKEEERRKLVRSALDGRQFIRNRSVLPNGAVRRAEEKFERGSLLSSDSSSCGSDALRRRRGKSTDNGGPSRRKLQEANRSSPLDINKEFEQGKEISAIVPNGKSQCEDVVAETERGLKRPLFTEEGGQKARLSDQPAKKIRSDDSSEEGRIYDSDQEGDTAVCRDAKTEALEEDDDQGSVGSNRATVAGRINPEKASAAYRTMLLEKGQTPAEIDYEMACHMRPEEARKEHKRRRQRANLHLLKRYKVEQEQKGKRGRLSNARATWLGHQCDTGAASRAFQWQADKSLRRELTHDERLLTQKRQRRITRRLALLQKARDRGLLSPGDFEREKERVFDEIFEIDQSGRVAVRRRDTIELLEELELGEGSESEVTGDSVVFTGAGRASSVGHPRNRQRANAVSLGALTGSDEAAAPMHLNEKTLEWSDSGNGDLSQSLPGKGGRNGRQNGREDRLSAGSLRHAIRSGAKQRRTRPHYIPPLAGTPKPPPVAPPFRIDVNFLLSSPEKQRQQIEQVQRTVMRKEKGYELRQMLMRRFDQRAPPEFRMFHQDTFLHTDGQPSKKQLQDWELMRQPSELLPDWMKGRDPQNRQPFFPEGKKYKGQTETTASAS